MNWIYFDVKSSITCKVFHIFLWRGKGAQDFNHPVFRDTRVVSSFYKKSFKGVLDKNLIKKIQFDGIDDDALSLIQKPNTENLYKLAAKFSDGIVFENNYKNTELLTFEKNNEIPLLSPKEHAEYYDFYQNFFSEELV